MPNTRILCTLLAVVLTSTSSALAEMPSTKCVPGYYQLAGGSGVDIAPSDDSHLRWRRTDGTSGLLSASTSGRWTCTLGWTGRADGTVVDLSDCQKGEVQFAELSAQRVHFDTEETRFSSRGGVRLAGRLVLPAGQAAVPIVVLVHG